MPISGLVVTFGDAPQVAEAARRRLNSVGVFILAEPIGPRTPVVLEADSDEEARYWHDWLVGIEGVEQVDIAFVSLEEGEDGQ